MKLISTLRFILFPKFLFLRNSLSETLLLHPEVPPSIPLYIIGRPATVIYHNHVFFLFYKILSKICHQATEAFLPHPFGCFSRSHCIVCHPYTGNRLDRLICFWESCPYKCFHRQIRLCQSLIWSLYQTYPRSRNYFWEFPFRIHEGCHATTGLF